MVREHGPAEDPAGGIQLLRAGSVGRPDASWRCRKQPRAAALGRGGPAAIRQAWYMPAGGQPVPMRRAAPGALTECGPGTRAAEHGRVKAQSPRTWRASGGADRVTPCGPGTLRRRRRRHLAGDPGPAGGGLVARGRRLTPVPGPGSPREGHRSRCTGPRTWAGVPVAPPSDAPGAAAGKRSVRQPRAGAGRWRLLARPPCPRAMGRGRCRHLVRQIRARQGRGRAPGTITGAVTR